MHNRKPDGVTSREIGWRDGAIVGGLVACIVALALYPGLILERAEDSVTSTVAGPRCEVVEGQYSNRTDANPAFAIDCPELAAK
jgi:hypothetical protein